MATERTTQEEVPCYLLTGASPEAPQVLQQVGCCGQTQGSGWGLPKALYPGLPTTEAQSLCPARWSVPGRSSTDAAFAGVVSCCAG
jgi:hypothetical protein